MELRDISFGGTKAPWNSMEYSMEFLGTELYFIWRYQSSMEFHGIFHGIPWNTCVSWNGALLIPWNPMELGDFFIWRLHSSMKFHGISHASPGWHGIDWNDNLKVPWNSMELSDISLGGTRVPLEFHGIRWNLVIVHLGALEFHGISCHSTFHGTSVVSWNSMELLN